MSLPTFHPAVSRWFGRTFDEPTTPQRRGWPAIRSGHHTLIAAPTGTGKTLAAFLHAIDDLVRRGVAGTLGDRTYVLYVSPLKALGNDVRRNLGVPLDGIAAELAAEGIDAPGVRAQVRSGDTPQSERAAMLRRPPHILVTTPESLYLLLTSDGGRGLLGDVETVIVDEIHALADDRRGAHLSLSLERLEALTGRPLQRIGLSATQRPIEEVARFLIGAGSVDPDGRPRCEIVDATGQREMDLAIELPGSPLEALMSGEIWEELYDRLAALAREHETTLVFVNTRRVAERLARHLGDRLGEEAVAAHHGSLSKERRLDAESRLKSGELRAMVATASLELGIDIGAIDLVVQIGSPRSISTLLQRVGRAGHHVGGVPRGRVFPLSRDDLVESIAAIAAARAGDLDVLEIPPQPLDVLSQQIVAACASREWSESELYDCLRRAWPYRDLTREAFDEIVEMLADGFTTRRGQRGRYLHLDAVNGVLRGRRGARLTALTCGGAIPDTFEFTVVQEPAGIPVGTVDEEFAVESSPGDVFQLGTTSWKILRTENGTVRVEDARGQPPTVPFWFGEAPGRTGELSEWVSGLRLGVDERLGGDGRDTAAATAWLQEWAGIDDLSASVAVDYLAAARAALAAMPSRDTLVIERFFDQAGDMHLVIHSPFGIRLNRAWGLSLRKVFCRTFNFELQAAASDDALVLSLGPTHSFPLEEVFDYLKPGKVRDKLVQALLDSPLFPTRWRWNASRALAIKRYVGGRRIAPQLQRMDAEDLLAVVFPDQLACLENIQGDREIPDHPLVRQTIEDCLQEAMDFHELEQLLSAIASGDKRLVARDVREPSPMAQEILVAPPYAFLDDAPAEERRTLAVQSRRWLDPESADDLSALDPSAIERVRSESVPSVQGDDDLHDALGLHGFLTAAEGSEWRAEMERLGVAGRAAELTTAALSGPLWVSAERLHIVKAALTALARSDKLALAPAIEVPERYRRRVPSGEEALRETVRGRLQMLGPVTVERLAAPLGGDAPGIQAALMALEAEGFAFRGRFTPGEESLEWCERRLLARIHRYTLNRLRAEIEPVEPAVFLRFLTQWQRVDESSRAEGPESLAAILDQLEGFEVAAGGWESDVIPARLRDYDPVWLDALCLSGRFMWQRQRSPQSGPRGTGRPGPVRSTPIALLPRSRRELWQRLVPFAPEEATLSADARRVLAVMRQRPAAFFQDLLVTSGLLESQLEAVIGELVFHGLVASDGYTGIRALLVPSARRRTRAGARRRAGVATFGMDNAGRWSPREVGGEPELDEHDAERAAEILLRRYGVLFRTLLTREPWAPPWRDLVRVCHRLEARGDLRGGRFVAGFGGAQFALPEAVGRLRAVRREEPEGRLVSLSAVDPLNLVGVVTPGERLPAIVDNRLLLRDGVPIAVREGGTVRILDDTSAEEAWKLEAALVRRQVPARLRAYLGRPA